jgi:hypothetical protein
MRQADFCRDRRGLISALHIQASGQVIPALPCFLDLFHPQPPLLNFPVTSLSNMILTRFRCGLDNETTATDSRAINRGLWHISY